LTRRAVHRPMRLLQKLPPLQAQRVISYCVRLVRMLPRDLYERLARHPWDRRLYAPAPAPAPVPARRG
jgi:hypothetical protein